MGTRAHTVTVNACFAAPRGSVRWRAGERPQALEQPLLLPAAPRAWLPSGRLAYCIHDKIVAAVARPR